MTASSSLNTVNQNSSVKLFSPLYSKNSDITTFYSKNSNIKLFYSNIVLFYTVFQ